LASNKGADGGSCAALDDTLMTVMINPILAADVMAIPPYEQTIITSQAFEINHHF
jgi:hypothetical protein